MLTVTLFATAAAYAWDRGIDITLTNSVIPLFTVVVRLVTRPKRSDGLSYAHAGRHDSGVQLRVSFSSMNNVPC